MKLPAFFLFFAMCSMAMAATTNEQLEQLKDVIREEIRHPDSKDPSGIPNAMSLQVHLVELLGAVDSDNPTQRTISALNEIQPLLSSKESRALCDGLAKQIREENARREKACVDQMRTEYTAVVRAALNAKDIKELDPLIMKVNRLVADARSFPDGGKVKEMAFQGGRLSEFLCGWQTILSGSRRESFANLQSLINQDRNFGDWLPRSEVLTRLNAAEAEMYPGKASPAAEKEVEAKARQIVADTHTLADMKGSLEKLEALSAASPRSNSYLSTMSSYLSSLQTYYLESEQGISQTSTVFFVNHLGGANAEELASLRAQLVLHIVYHFLRVAETDAPKPDENTASYLRRVKTKARDEANWEQLSRILEVEQGSQLSPTSSNDLNAMHSYLAGTNLVRARQYALAVTAFHRSLNTGSQLISAEMIGDRLDDIRKQHPQEYETGMKVLLSPPPTPPTANKAQ